MSSISIHRPPVKTAAYQAALDCVLDAIDRLSEACEVVAAMPPNGLDLGTRCDGWQLWEDCQADAAAIAWTLRHAAVDLAAASRMCVAPTRPDHRLERDEATMPEADHFPAA